MKKHKHSADAAAQRKQCPYLEFGLGLHAVYYVVYFQWSLCAQIHECTYTPESESLLDSSLYAACGAAATGRHQRQLCAPGAAFCFSLLHEKFKGSCVTKREVDAIDARP